MDLLWRVRVSKWGPRGVDGFVFVECPSYHGARDILQRVFKETKWSEMEAVEPSVLAPGDHVFSEIVYGRIKKKIVPKNGKK